SRLSRRRGGLLRRRHLRLHFRVAGLGITRDRSDGGGWVVLAEPNQHHFPIRIHAGERSSTNLRKRLHCIAMYLCHATHRVAGGEHTSETRRQQYIASFNVGVGWK